MNTAFWDTDIEVLEAGIVIEPGPHQLIPPRPRSTDDPWAADLLANPNRVDQPPF